MKSSKQRCWRHAILVFILCPLMVLADNKTLDSDEVIERVLWKKTPITVTLIVGQERMVHFPDSVSVGIPQSLTQILQSQSINGTLYLTAQQAFASTRVVVRSEQAESIYVLDISARERSSQNIHLPALQVLTEHPSKGESTPGSAEVLSPQWGYVALTRYAAQQRYAPARLLTRKPGVVRMPVTQISFELLMGAQVDAVPVAAWRAGLRTVTAVKLINKTQQALVLDPRQLRGAWLTATFQHNRLLPSGNDADSTTVYLVSDRPFESSL